MVNKSFANEYILQQLQIVNDPLSVNVELENIHTLYPNLNQSAECFINPSSAHSFVNMSRAELAHITVCFRPDIQVVYHNYKAALARLGQARGSRLPEIDWTANGNERRLDKFVIDPTRPELDVLARRETTIRQGFNFIWKITNFGATSALINRAELQAKSVAYELVANTNNSILEALLAQEDLKGSIRVLQLYKEAKENAKINLDIAIERQRLGVGSQSDVITTQTLYNRTEIDILQTLNEIAQKYNGLLNALGIGKRVNPDFDSNTFQPISQSALNINSGIDKSVLFELANNLPERLSAIYAYKATLKRVEEIEKENNPSIVLSTSNGVYQNKIDSGTNFKTNESTVNLTLKVPLFSGFTNTYKVKESIQQASSQEMQLMTVENKIQKEVIANLKQFENELLVKSKLEEYIELSEFNLNAMKEKYLRGVADISYLLNANKELITARVELARGMARLVTSQIKYLYFQGKINDAY
jgi:outer membrane protein TolC